MYLKYGNYRHAADEVVLAIARDAVYAENGVQRALRVRWDISGRLHADTQAALTSGLAALESAYVNGAGDIGLYQDDGTATAHNIAANSTGGGIRVVRAVSYPDGRGAEYSTWRNYTVSIEAEVLNFDARILNWSETIAFAGGGPQFGYLETLNGPPQLQLLKQATTYKATQRGSAVGQFGYVMPPAPLWSQAFHEDRSSVDYAGPKRKGSLGQPFYTDYRTTWSYVFESAVPLFGAPTVQAET